MNGQNKGWHVGEELRSGLWFKKVAYLLLSFPLGTFYFVFLVTGISFGIALAVLIAGIFILAGTIAASAVFGRFERIQNRVLLGIPVPVAAGRDPDREPGVIAWLKRVFSDHFAWMSMLYLFLKFPFGIVSFVITITLLVLSISLVLVPVFFGVLPVNIDNQYWSVETFEEALLASLAGLILAGVSVFLFSGLATLWGHFACFMLKERGAASRVAPDSRPVVIE
jgi:hypothetical protein